jgi:hypothetical protein
VTITLRIPGYAAGGVLAIVLVILGHVRVAVPAFGAVPVPVLLLITGLIVGAVAAAVAVWLIVAGRPGPAPTPPRRNR